MLRTKVHAPAVNVLIIPDKFKGTLTAHQAAQALARGWRRTRPRDRLKLLPMSDGGDGFGAVMSQLLGAEKQVTRTVDAAHRPCRAVWFWEQKSKTAIIETSRVIGLAMLPPGKFHPFELDTFGLGAVLAAAATKGAEHFLIGLGGSATNDGGFGLARALDWRFLDAQDTPLERWTQLVELEHIEPCSSRRRAADRRSDLSTNGRPFPPLPWGEGRGEGEGRAQKICIRVAVDVQNPLLGTHGATRVYGPQKGLRGADLDLAEKCLRRVAAVTERDLQTSFAKFPGAGAAGGLGFGLAAFCGAQLEPGFALFARHAQLEEKLKGAHLVLTGEGSLDKSSFMGKGVGELARWCQRLDVPCICFAGVQEAGLPTRNEFRGTIALTELTGQPDAKRRAAFWLEQAAKRAARTLVAES